MREPRERSRPPLSNMFEKRREIQKEIERAQQLLSESADHNVDAGSRQDSESNEGEELERVRFSQSCLIFLHNTCSICIW